MTALNLSLRKYENKPGFLCLANNMENGWKQEFFSTRDLMLANSYIVEHKQYDSYNSLATFRSAWLNRNNIAIITEHCIDIDNHLAPPSENEAKEFVKNVLEPLYDIAIPTPSLVVYTGRGIQVHFNLEGASDIIKWEHTQQALMERLEEICNKENILLNIEGLGVDFACKNSTRVFRTPGTTNTKVNRTAKAIFRSKSTYTQNEIATNFNLTWTTEKGKGKGTKHQLSELAKLDREQVLRASQRELKEFKGYSWRYSIETLRQARREDFIKLIEIRNSKGIREGYRNNLLSIAVQLERESTNDINELANRLFSYNEYFIEPLAENEVISWVRSATRKRIHYKNNSIIKKLDITRSEQEQLQTLITRSVKNSRYYKKNQEQLNQRSKERYKPTKIINVSIRNSNKLWALELRQQGESVQDIAKKLGKNRMTIYRYLKEVK